MTLHTESDHLHLVTDPTLIVFSSEGRRQGIVPYQVDHSLVCSWHRFFQLHISFQTCNFRITQQVAEHPAEWMSNGCLNETACVRCQWHGLSAQWRAREWNCCRRPFRCIHHRLMVHKRYSHRC